MNLAGNTILLKVGDVSLDCQLDSTFKATANVTAGNPCKGDDKAVTNTVSSTAWSIDFNGKTQTGTPGTSDQSLLLDTLQDGTAVEVVFAPDADLNPGATSNWVLTGNALVTDVTINAPVDGESTYSGTFTGTGAFVKTVVPVV